VVDGVLWIRAESAMLGYLNAPLPFNQEGWFNTKDARSRWRISSTFRSHLGDYQRRWRESKPAEVESVLLQMNIFEMSREVLNP